jgi:predicted unusual protein kinase regulating ubiquinone biosynthesis (AarF/ABC1/UbiB family)
VALALTLPLCRPCCRFPATFTFVLRAFSTLEGIGKSLNPDFKFVEVATPYAQELLTVRPNPLLLLLLLRLLLLMLMLLRRLLSSHTIGSWRPPSWHV